MANKVVTHYNVQAQKEVDRKAERIKKDRAEATKLASKANKRIKRLESNNMTDSPAYDKYIKGQGKFSVRGKTHNEVQKEVSRLNKFLDSQTSTIRGISSNLKEMAANTGIKYKNLKDLKSKASKFFELSSKVEQYLRTVDDIASAIGYQKIWEAVNEYTKLHKNALSDGEDRIDDMVKAVTDALKNYESKTPLEIPSGSSYKLIDGGTFS